MSPRSTSHDRTRGAINRVGEVSSSPSARLDVDLTNFPSSLPHRSRQGHRRQGFRAQEGGALRRGHRPRRADPPRPRRGACALPRNPNPDRAIPTSDEGPVSSSPIAPYGQSVSADRQKINLEANPLTAPPPPFPPRRLTSASTATAPASSSASTTRSSASSSSPSPPSSSPSSSTRRRMRASRRAARTTTPASPSKRLSTNSDRSFDGRTEPRDV